VNELERIHEGDCVLPTAKCVLTRCIVESLISLDLMTCERFQDKKGCKLEAELLFLTDNQFGHSEYKIKISVYGFVYQYGYSILNALSAFSLK